MSKTNLCHRPMMVQAFEMRRMHRPQASCPTNLENEIWFIALSLHRALHFEICFVIQQFMFCLLHNVHVPREVSQNAIPFRRVFMPIHLAYELLRRYTITVSGITRNETHLNLGRLLPPNLEPSSLNRKP